MRRKTILQLAAVSAIVVLLILGALVNHPLAKQKYTASNIPTLFFHGSSSSYHAEEHMANAAKKTGVTKTIVVAEVHRNGQVSLHGHIPAHPVNPIVEVNFDNNMQLSYPMAGVWAGNVVRRLKKEYEFNSVNMVGHSLGAIAVVYYAINYGNDKQMPALAKMVTIAGHFDGFDWKDRSGKFANIVSPGKIHLDKDGKPDKMNATYRRMLVLRNDYPQGKTRVLNIFGNTGNGTDNEVQNNSSRSLRYLIGNHARSYKELMIKGKNSNHSGLHNNPRVDKALINFLWAK